MRAPDGERVGGRLDGKVAIVTGAGSGIGAATAALLAEAGASVVVGDIDRTGAHATADSICAAGGSAAAFAVDISDESQVASMVAHTIERFGGVDVLHNNAALV